MNNHDLLLIKNLKIFFRMARGTLKAVDGVSFAIEKGQVWD